MHNQASSKGCVTLLYTPVTDTNKYAQSTLILYSNFPVRISFFKCYEANATIMAVTSCGTTNTNYFFKRAETIHQPNRKHMMQRTGEPRNGSWVQQFNKYNTSMTHSRPMTDNDNTVAALRFIYLPILNPCV